MVKSSSGEKDEDLEKRVEALETKLQKMLPGRREVLAGGAAAGAGLLGFGAGSASADGLNDGDTQWGSDSNRDDYVGDHLDFNSASIGELLGTVTGDQSVTNLAGTNLSIDGSGNLNASGGGSYTNVASSQVALSSGSATVDTGITATDATFMLALGIDDPNADAKVAGRLFWDDSVGSYHVEIVEDGTSIGNPTVNYDILRVR